ncbi:MAG: hypothetical protein HY927_01835 [Elusimicrobia bacterium]|nr:hypothetical protein [Elusimicrobiota bacterium]
MDQAQRPPVPTRRHRAALWALGLALLLTPASAAVNGRGAAGSPPPPATFFGLNAFVALDDIRRDLSERLAGRGEADWDALESRLKALEERLADGSMLPDEAAGLRPEIDRLLAVIAQARGAVETAALRLDPRRNAAGDDAGRLRLAAGDPSAASRVFDNNRFLGSGAPTAVPGSTDGGRKRVPVSTTRQGKTKDIDLTVPSLSPTDGPKTARAREPGRPEVQVVTKRIIKLLDGAGKLLSYEVGVSDLLRAADAKSRAALGREIASEVLRIAGRADPGGSLSSALADFLRDVPDYKPADASAVRLSVDDKNHYRLIFERAGSGQRILVGQFLPSSAGKPGPTAFIVMGAIETDAAGRARQDHQGYWREYLGGDKRLEWTSTDEKERKGWGPWAHENQLRGIWLAEQSWTEGRWREVKKAQTSAVTAKEGQSWFGRAGAKLMKAPVLGPTLKFCDDVAGTLYTGIVAVPSVIGAAAGSDALSLEAAGSYAKNPLMKKLLDDKGYLDRLTPGARKELYDKVRENRLTALQSQPFPIPPDLARDAVNAPISDKEAVQTLSDGYGAGSYGKRIIAEGIQSTGWKRGLLTTAGIVTGVAESVGESFCNPVMWAMLGAGHVAAAVKGSSSFVAGSTGAQAAFTAANAAHKVLTVAWWTPWLLSASDNVGKMVLLTAEGKFDDRYYKNVSELSADIIYLFAVP